MTINVNNQAQHVVDNSSIVTLLEQLQIASKGIAIAINNQIISKDHWAETSLQGGDQVTIIKATQGG